MCNRIVKDAILSTLSNAFNNGCLSDKDKSALIDGLEVEGVLISVQSLNNYGQPRFSKEAIIGAICFASNAVDARKSIAELNEYFDFDC